MIWSVEVWIKRMLLLSAVRTTMIWTEQASGLAGAGTLQVSLGRPESQDRQGDPNLLVEGPLTDRFSRDIRLQAPIPAGTAQVDVTTRKSISTRRI